MIILIFLPGLAIAALMIISPLVGFLIALPVITIAAVAVWAKSGE